MRKLRSVFTLLASAIMLPLYAGSRDTLSVDEGIKADTFVVAEVPAPVTADLIKDFHYSSFRPIGENGPLSLWPSRSSALPAYSGFGIDPLSIVQDSVVTQGDSLKQKWYNRRIVKSSIFPLALIGYGVSVMKDNGLYSSYDAKRDIRKVFGSYRSPIDDYLIWAPYAELGLLNLFKIRCKTDAINTSLLILKSELIMTAIVFPLKQFSNQLRPDSSNYHSFPSGHTANAFVAASVVHKEYRHLSPWYGVGAYTIATSVAVFRMINNKHWQSDVIAGAGIGLLATHIAYTTHRYRWGRKDVCFVPTIGNGHYGGAMVYQF